MSEPKAVVHVFGHDLMTGITPSKHALVLDSDHTRAPSPMELLMIALGSCTAVDVISILQKKRQDVKAYRVEASDEPNIREASQSYWFTTSLLVVTFQSDQWPRQSNSLKQNIAVSRPL